MSFGSGYGVEFRGFVTDPSFAGMTGWEEPRAKAKGFPWKRSLLRRDERREEQRKSPKEKWGLTPTNLHHRFNRFYLVVVIECAAGDKGCCN